MLQCDQMGFMWLHATALASRVVPEKPLPDHHVAQLERNTNQIASMLNLFSRMLLRN
jgi:hypothetical protein